MKRKINLLSFVVFALIAIGCADHSYEAADAATMTKSVTNGFPQRPQVGRANLVSKEASSQPQSIISQRAVVRRADLTVRVIGVEDAERQTTTLITGLGGFVISSESSNLNETAPTMTMKLRVPVANFEEALLKLERMGTRLSKRTSGEDVTGQLVDFNARLKTMRAQEDAFRNMLSKSAGSEAYDLQTRLMELRGQIESLAGQQKSLSELAALSTIDLTLVSTARPMAQTNDKAWLSESWNSATSAFGSATAVVGTAFVFLLVFAPLWAPLAYLAWRHARRGFQEDGVRATE